VPESVGDYLIVSAGPPVERIVQGSDISQWELRPADLDRLELDDASPVSPSWVGAVPRDLSDTVCLEVLHSTEGTPTATCRPVPASTRPLDLHGAYVPPSLRKSMLTALGVDSLPTEGLVLGRVVDDKGAPISGLRVVPTPPATIVYVAGDGNRVDDKSIETSASGMWISIDAAPRTTWSIAGTVPSPIVPSAIGGRIAGHLTVVELVLGTPTTTQE